MHKTIFGSNRLSLNHVDVLEAFSKLFLGEKKIRLEEKNGGLRFPGKETQLIFIGSIDLFSGLKKMAGKL
jgi:hypothetical protein